MKPQQKQDTAAAATLAVIDSPHSLSMPASLSPNSFTKLKILAGSWERYGRSIAHSGGGKQPNRTYPCSSILHGHDPSGAKHSPVPTHANHFAAMPCRLFCSRVPLLHEGSVRHACSISSDWLNSAPYRSSLKTCALCSSSAWDFRCFRASSMLVCVRQDSLKL